MGECMKSFSSTFLGYGLGLRSVHYQEILDTRPPIDFFEVMTEDYLEFNTYASQCLERIREAYPVVMHGVSMSIGSFDPLNWTYLEKVKALSDRIEAAWISDHLCWTGVQGVNLHDLLPLPYTEEMLNYLVERILQVQEYFQQPLLLENPSTYLSFKQNEMPEWEFLARLVKKTDCRLLLDVNNVYVSAFNHEFDALDYLAAIPQSCVQQIHIAGHKNYGTHIIDTHDETIIEPVWDLYAEAINRFGEISTSIERDDHIPALSELMEEVQQARNVGQRMRVAA